MKLLSAKCLLIETLINLAGENNLIVKKTYWVNKLLNHENNSLFSIYMCGEDIYC